MRLLLVALLFLSACNQPDYVSKIKELEGFEERPYRFDETEEHLTVGYGHYGPDVKPNMVLSQKEAEDLLRKDLDRKLKQVRKHIPDFDSFSKELKIEIVQSWYRGGIAGSPKTIQLINKKKFDEASIEFLRNQEYLTTPHQGVKKRMEAVSQALQKEHERWAVFPWS